ncbi:Protein boule-like [Vulpes lagopus]
MEPESGAQTSNQTQTDSLSPSPNPVSPVPLNNPTSAPRYGTVIPNRIFVGGIDFKYGYGFVTFETQEDAQKILQEEAEKLNYKDKKLNIGPAIRKQQVGIPRSSIMPAAGTMYLTTSTGYPYTYHNGVAYFHTPEVTSVPPPWPSRSISSSPVMVAQPVYQQPAYHYQAPAQYLPGQWQWGVPQSPASTAPFLYLQPSEVIYQPVEIAQDGGCVPPPLSLMEASVPEPYSDHGVQATYHQVYAPSAIAMPAPVMQPEPIKNFPWYTKYPDDMIIYIENPKELTKKLLEVEATYNKTAGYKNSVEHSLLRQLGSSSPAQLISCPMILVWPRYSFNEPARSCPL